MLISETSHSPERNGSFVIGWLSQSLVPYHLLYKYIKGTVAGKGKVSL